MTSTEVTYRGNVYNFGHPDSAKKIQRHLEEHKTAIKVLELCTDLSSMEAALLYIMYHDTTVHNVDRWRKNRCKIESRACGTVAGERIRQCMEEKGITIDELRRELGMANNAIVRRWVEGTGVPKKFTRQMLGDLFGKDPDYFYSDETGLRKNL